MFRRPTLVLILLLLTYVLPGYTQNVSGTIRGTVHDPSGAIIRGADVVITNTGTASSQKTVTSASGDYIALELPVGTYSVAVSAQGFETNTYNGIILNVDQNARVDATLKVGNTSQSFEVSATSIMIQSEDATNGNLISGKELQELPSNNRNIWSQAQLLPNVSATTSGDSLANRGGFVVAGIAAANNNYLIDGSDDNDWTTGQPTVRPSIDAISDFRVITGEAPAEYGSKNGGQVVLNTRSGTKNWHGGAFFFYRDGKWNAPLYNFQYPAVQVVPPTQSKQFGGSLGGPIFKKSTFFFATYEATRASADPGISGTTVLDAWRGGKFTPDGNPQFTTQILDPTTGLSFPQISPGIWEIPASRVSASNVLLNYYPTSTAVSGTVGSFANHIANTQSENQGTFRVDHKFSASDSLFSVYTLLQGYDAGTTGDLVVGNSTVPGFGGAGPHIYQHGSIAWDHIFTANLVNSLRIGFNRMDAGYYNQDEQYGNVVGQLGLPQGGDYLRLPTSHNLGTPSISVTGLSSLGSTSNPQWRGDNTVNLSEALTWVYRKHTVKAGLQAIDFFKHSFFITSGRGSFSFNGQYTGASGNSQNAFADFLLGYISSDGFNTGVVDQYPIQRSGALYLEDEWQAVPSLTLNYGLRWDYLGPVREAYNNISYFDSTKSEVFTGPGQGYILNANGALVTADKVPSRRDNYAAIYHNFAPRVGFAWRINGTDHTVLRGGFGIFYGLPSIQTWNSANGLGTPFVLSNSFTGPTPNATTHITTNPFTWSSNTFGGPIDASRSRPLNSISVTTIDPQIKNIATTEFSLGIQHQLGKSALIEITYQGSVTRHNVTTIPLNNITLATRLANPAASTTINSLRPYNTIGSQSKWAGISSVTDSASANYNSLLLQAQRRFENGLTFQSYLVWAKALEYGGYTPDPAFPSWTNYGPSSASQKLRSITTVLYHVPIGTGQRWFANSPSAVRYVISGWQGSAILALQSGRPFSASSSDTYSAFSGLSGNAFINPGGGSTTAAVDTATGARTHTIKNWYNTGAYRSNDPANGTKYTNQNVTATSGYVYNYGNVPNNNLVGPGLQDVDLGLIKEFRILEHQSVEFKAEAFNLLNHPNFTNPSASYGGTGPSGTTSGTTGVIRSTVATGSQTAMGANRQLQLSLRYSF